MRALRGSYDVVVVGSGGGGLSAATTAAARGADVLLVEADEVVGGTFSYSTGILWMPANRYAAESGIEDSLGAARQHVERLSGGRHDDALLSVFLERGNEALDFLDSQGARFELMPGYADTLPDVVGGLSQGRALSSPVFDPTAELPERWRDRLAVTPYYGRIPASLREIQEWGGYAAAASWDHELLAQRRVRNVSAFGTGVAGYLLATALRAGVHVATGTRLVELVTDRPRASVRGVAVESNGSIAHVGSRYGVVLATGGYDHSAQLQSRLDPHPVVPSLTHKNVDGSGIVLAMALGAGFCNLGGQLLSPVCRVPDGGGARWELIAREVAFPGGIVVNREGRRFADDSFGWALTQAMGQFDHVRGAYVNTPAYFIFDEEWKRRYRLGDALPGEVPEWLARADGPAGVARELGLDPVELARTIDEFNRDAASGCDPRFGRGSTGFARNAGDPSVGPNPCVRPLEGTLFGLRLDAGSMGTLSGVLVGPAGEVRRHDGSRIEGLYATGNTMANLVEGNFYTGGMANSRALVFGYLAAVDATA